MTDKNNTEKIWETAKFVLRYVILIGGPIIVKQLTNLEGEWGAFFSRELPVVLPLIDRWLYLNKDIPLKGITQF